MTQLTHFMSYCLSEQRAVQFEVWFLPLWCVNAVLHLDIIHAKSNGILNNILGIVNPLSVCVWLPLSPSFYFFCLIFWPISAICASATFGTSPPTRTCAKPGTPNQTKTRSLAQFN